MNMFKKSLTVPSLLIITAFAFLALQGCGSKDPNSPNFVVAEGKGVKITRKQLNEAEKQFFAMRGWDKSQIPAQAMAQIEKEIVQQLVMKELLLKKAGSGDKKKIDEEVNKQVTTISERMGGQEQLQKQLSEQGLTIAELKKDMEDQFLIREYLEKAIPVPADPSEQEVREFYNANKENFNRPELVEASHVLILVPEGSSAEVKAEKKKAAEAALERVKKGEDFAAVASAVSEDPGSAARGGQLGAFGRKQMVPEFENVAFSTKPGEVSRVFETPYGFHFLKVTDKKAAGMVPFEEAAPQITQYLVNMKRAQELQEFLKKIEEEAAITYHLAAADQPAAAQ
ncbi:peptidylprolyl isomerase [Oscillatoria laete-virens NRMC-F 0139]|nr:peptidylprolyl isomerase [Oscillatoria laete-virens]MDL5055078.1 peptidylprolyl isomerase [Oscillatoria laete-virens NRMC-F 0139]